MIAQRLKEAIQQGCVFVGVGNVLRGDDAFGPFLAKRLSADPSLSVVDAGLSPENFTGVITRLNRSTIVIIDAVSLDAAPGTVHWVNAEDLDSSSFSTHGPAMDLFLIYMKQSLGASVYILGIVPFQTELGSPMSEAVRAQAIKWAETIMSI